MSSLPSHYKLRNARRGPCCLVCQTLTRGDVGRVHIALGEYVWLCDRHASVAFRRQNSGRDFYLCILKGWQSAGCLNSRRRRALDMSLHRDNRERAEEAGVGRAPRPRKGSYCWPKVRQMVEDACRRGQLPIARLAELVEAFLRAERRRDRVQAPSARSLRRWRLERRWELPEWEPPAAAFHG